MSITNKDYKTEFLIFRIFLKYVKKHNMYSNFRCSVNHTLTDRDFFHIINRRSNAQYGNNMNRLSAIHSQLLRCKDCNDILEIIRQMNCGKLKIENTADGQMKVMNIINTLIHCCIEYAVFDGRNFSLLEKLGEEIYNEVCSSLFGNDFVDKTEELMRPSKDGLKMIPPSMRDMLGRNGDIEIDREKFLEFLHHLERNRRNVVMPPPPQNCDFYYPFGDEYDDFDVETWTD